MTFFTFFRENPFSALFKKYRKRLFWFKYIGEGVNFEKEKPTSWKTSSFGFKSSFLLLLEKKIVLTSI